MKLQTACFDGLGKTWLACALGQRACRGNRARPVLARVLERIGKGDTLVVVRIDRLARSLSHLLEVIERLEASGV